ncbi:MAG: hypothetical protein GX916_00675 [Clostridiales bacterium]|nr:hypothetical protein [Clostridiales bacterium]
MRKRRAGERHATPPGSRSQAGDNPRYARYQEDWYAPLPLDDQHPSQWAQHDADDSWHEHDEPASYIHQPLLSDHAGDGWAQNIPLRKPCYNRVWALLIVLSLLLMTGMAYVVYAFYQPAEYFNKQKQWMDRDTFFDSIYVDNVHIGGLTYDQAEKLLAMNAAAAGQELSLSVCVDGTTWRVTNDQIPFERNIKAVLNAAYAIGRQGFDWMIGSGSTPFETRFKHTQQTIRDKAYLITQTTYNTDDVHAMADSIAASVTRQPVNAIIESFDFDTKEFTVTQDVQGATLDARALFEKIKDALDARNYAGMIDMQTTPIMPAVTSIELKNGFALLASFTTNTTNDEKRNTNISLSARALSGTVVMPDETFSFNDRVGERTAQKGYQMAPAISGGVTFDEIGGGVCQVSSTLFNAVAMAGMELVSRSPHAWPSSYIDKGLDATVNWPNLDFKFRNNKSTPVFIVAFYNKRKVTVEVYGMMSGPGESISLETSLISTTPPPNEPVYQQNPALPPGTRKPLKKARTGYVVDTYRVYKRNGQEYRREKLTTSNYRMIPETIEYN